LVLEVIEMMKNMVLMAALLLAPLLAATACSGAPDKQATSPASSGTPIAQGEVCPTASAGPPPTCPDGCAWNGTECRASRPIVIFDVPPATSTATNTATATKIIAPSSP
jgi:hypothetical protein